MTVVSVPEPSTLLPALCGLWLVTMRRAGVLTLKDGQRSDLVTERD